MKNLFYVACILIVTVGCNSANQDQNKNGETKDSIMNKKNLGAIGNDSVFEFTLRNKKGMEVRILNYGGTITHIMVPDKNNQVGDVVLGFDSLSGYLQKGNPYIGALVGRYGN